MNTGKAEPRIKHEEVRFVSVTVQKYGRYATSTQEYDMDHPMDEEHIAWKASMLAKDCYEALKP